MITPALDTPERAIVSVVNTERARHGLRALRPSGALSRAAATHTADMLRVGSLTHTASGGSSFGARLGAFGSWTRTGEALAFSNRRSARARSFLRIWLRSPAHRTLLLDGSFSKVGVGREKGRIGGLRGTVVTLDLAS